MNTQQHHQSLFGELINIESIIQETNKKLTISGIMIGIVTHIEKGNTGRVRIKHKNLPGNYSSYWLEPARTVSLPKVGDTVLYCYPTQDFNYGVYFAKLGLNDSGEGVTEEWVTDQIVQAIAAYDPAIKAWVASNYIDNAELIAALAGYVTNSSLSSQLAAYATQAYVNSAIAALPVSFRGITHLINNTANQAVALPPEWKNGRITIVHSSKPFPAPSAVQETTPTYTYQINATNNGSIAVNDTFRFIINTTARIIFQAQDGVILAGTTNGSFAVGMGTQQEIKKTGSLTYTLTNIGLAA